MPLAKLSPRAVQQMMVRAFNEAKFEAFVCSLERLGRCSVDECPCAAPASLKGPDEDPETSIASLAVAESSDMVSFSLVKNNAPVAEASARSTFC